MLKNTSKAVHINIIIAKKSYFSKRKDSTLLKNVRTVPYAIWLQYFDTRETFKDDCTR